MSIVFYLERTNQLSLLPDKDLVDLCPPIEPYQVTKNHDIEHDFSALKRARMYAPVGTPLDEIIRTYCVA
ncbi:MAG: hypothetical protein EWV68_06580 [Microcystis sp. M_QC_C_20170808_M9Col]|nr:MAG: hypothetical protein EWV68_06580 [Microcystis sp. M_QC_C_20170808_M9Col]